MQKAGLSSSDIIVQNALGSDATEYSDAQADITKGASVLIMDGLDSGVGSRIESYAKAHGVPVVDYDRISLGGSRKYYVSFNNVQVGTLLGQGLVSCIANWKVSKPQVMVMHGALTDNNATLFADGYDAVLKPYFTNKTYVDSGYQCGTVYKPIYLEAQAAVALALYLRAGVTPPASLVNGTVKDINTGVNVPSILLTPEWVTPQTVNSTVIKDGFVPASQLCAGSYAADCTKYGISG